MASSKRPAHNTHLPFKMISRAQCPLKLPKCPSRWTSVPINACVRCPVETVPNYGYEYVQWDSLPPNIVTRCEYISEASLR
ncbi:hypothetical protein ANCDUO_18829 [Ancylostoma duodenale]|uniref:Uncharacterized protein n=1 Tax=Ancylostoma duodenale TaxID=51022 RepID=A0A0C2CMU8_9BILA|nr:hypothetical protein ANCDUO_18829 [Ancylostoma duodenale]